MSKKCRSCGESGAVVQTETYLYLESGLPSVVLVDVQVRRCHSCGRRELIVPRVTELHRTIAAAVIRKRTRLSGPEIRYLRKYLGWSGADFARHIGVEPSTVSNWETNKDPIGGTSDRLLRLMVAHGMPRDGYSLEELTKIGSEQTPPREVRVLLTARGWQCFEEGP